MKKVLVLGCSGSGKSTFSLRLGQLKSIPVIHLDAYFWKAGWVASTEEEWDKTLEELILQESYIMDGNYAGTLERRIKEADTAFFFDFPRFLCIYRVIKRRIRNHGKTRSDMAQGCPEKIDMEFLKWIWDFNRRSRKKVLEILEQAKKGKELIIFKSPKDVESYFKQLLR